MFAFLSKAGVMQTNFPKIFVNDYNLSTTSNWNDVNLLLFFLSTVTGFTLWGSVISVGIVCTLYTTIVSQLIFQYLSCNHVQYLFIFCHIMCTHMMNVNGISFVTVILAVYLQYFSRS